MQDECFEGDYFDMFLSKMICLLAQHPIGDRMRVTDSDGRTLNFGLTDQPIDLEADSAFRSLVVQENIASGSGNAERSGQSVAYASVCGVTVEKE